MFSCVTHQLLLNLSCFFRYRLSLTDYVLVGLPVIKLLDMLAYGFLFLDVYLFAVRRHVFFLTFYVIISRLL